MKTFMEAILVMGVIFLCKFIDWWERKKERYLAFQQDW